MSAILSYSSHGASMSPGCGGVMKESAAFRPSRGRNLTAIPVPQTPSSESHSGEGSHDGRNVMIIIIAVVALMVVGAFYIHQLVVTSTQLATPAGIQVTTSTPSIIDLGPEDLSMYVGMVIHNSGGTTATLEEIDYSVYANGAYVGSGRQTALNYTIPRKSYHGLSLPVGMSWGSASSSIGGYFVNGGQLTLEVRGTATVNVNRSTYAVPFDASITLEISAMTGASTSTATSP